MKIFLGWGMIMKNARLFIAHLILICCCFGSVLIAANQRPCCKCVIDHVRISYTWTANKANCGEQICCFFFFLSMSYE